MITQFVIHNSGKNYTNINNSVFSDYSLSAKAKGVLVQMLSLPPDWNWSTRGLSTLFSDGEESIKTAIKELEKAGYLRRSQKTTDKGQFAGYLYEVFDTKQPLGEIPLTETPLTSQKPQYNTNIINYEKINKENFILSNKAKESELSFDTPPDKTKISLEEKREACKRREDEFYNEVAKFVNDYPKEMLSSFFDYWSEPNKSGTKMRFESEKTFEIKRRLATWYKNESKFNKNGTGKLYSKARAEFEDFQVFNDSINRTLDKLYDE